MSGDVPRDLHVCERCKRVHDIDYACPDQARGLCEACRTLSVVRELLQQLSRALETRDLAVLGSTLERLEKTLPRTLR